MVAMRTLSSTRHLLPFVALACLGFATEADAATPLPPRSEWHATASSDEVTTMPPAFAIDGDDSTRWGGAFSPGNWLQLDFGRAAIVAGAIIRWDYGFATAYQIESSLDGRQWHAAFKTSDAQGGLDYVFFPPVSARYLRLASTPQTTDGGVAVFEFEPLSADDAPQVVGLAGGADPAALWSDGPPRELRAANAGARTVAIRFPRALPTAGLEVYWSAARERARLEARTGNEWQLLADDPDARGTSSYLAARASRTVDELRLQVHAGKGAPSIRRLRLLSPADVMTPITRYEIEASRGPSELHPPSLRAQQVYWTAVGVPAGRRKSIFDEYGNIEAFKGAALVQPVWRERSGRIVAAFDKPVTHRLREGWMPMPQVEWSPEPGLQLRTEAMTTEHGGTALTLVRYSLRNTSARPIEGLLALIARPMQINPRWQGGGASPIRQVKIEAENVQIEVDDRVLLRSLVPADERGASPFGAHGEQEITRLLANGNLPNSATARDEDGLAAAMLGYHVQLHPGAQREIVIAFPLASDTGSGVAASIDGVSAREFDTLAEQVAQQWRSRLGGVELSLPDRSLVDALRAQAAYMLINQSGPAMQPGPRNYNRSFIRDGSATAAILLRMGMSGTARDYLRWYTKHAVHPSGLVSPILNEDGTVNRGFGSDIEYDSQGQFVWLVAEVARLDGGPETVREYREPVQKALRFLQELRERTLVPGYLADQPPAERFRGILAPSISHEGYSTPTHSYWDDYWALKGWRDGAWLADAWGDVELASWARSQYGLLRESMAASIRSTMAWKHSEVIPTDADNGSGDPTSVSIALDPCGEDDLLPRDVLEHTFTAYLDGVRKRDTPGSVYAYTPYEMRNVLTFVHLNRPQDANQLLQRLVRDERPPEWHVLAEVVHSRLRHAKYLGDMPHTWVGAEYVRAVFGMLLHEDGTRLQLLPGAPPPWLEGTGLRVRGLPTAFGMLSMSAQQSGSRLEVVLETGLREGTALQVRWPSRVRPVRVTVDGKQQMQFTSDGIDLDKPFRRMVAEWL
jgi:hypothetical protein